MTWKQALTKAITAEVAAEKAATLAEEVRRQTWWNTTWALAAVPRAEWGEAQAEYVKRTGHAKRTADTRRQVGARLPETTLAGGLPQPRFAQEAATWIGKDGDEAKVKEAIKLLAQAERDEQSLREFHQALTGTSWTAIPENLTEADEDAVVEKVARTRPHAVARTVVGNPKATKAVHQEQSKRTQRIIKERRERIAAAGADVKGEVTDAVDAASNGPMSTSAAYNDWDAGNRRMVAAWMHGIKEQAFTALDRNMLGSELPRLRRIVEQITVFVEAEDDPYDAVKAHRAEVNDEIQRQLDEAESGTSLDTDEIERFANEASA